MCLIHPVGTITFVNPPSPPFLVLSASLKVGVLSPCLERCVIRGNKTGNGHKDGHKTGDNGTRTFVADLSPTRLAPNRFRRDAMSDGDCHVRKLNNGLALRGEVVVVRGFAEVGCMSWRYKPVREDS